MESNPNPLIACHMTCRWLGEIQSRPQRFHPLVIQPSNRRTCTEVHAPKEADDEHYNAELVGAAC
jgi:hypothetical protein